MKRERNEERKKKRETEKERERQRVRQKGGHEFITRKGCLVYYYKKVNTL